MTRPEHHLRNGRFRNPWPEAAGDDALRRRFGRVVWERVLTRLVPDPATGELPVAESGIARSAVAQDEIRVTWVGHATFLIQLPGLNLLTDPVWSQRVSPLASVGPQRFLPAVPEIDALPPIHGVLLSHDHYDHLDRPTVLALHRRFGNALAWYTPLGYTAWFERLGVQNVVERDWWESAELPGGRYQAVSAPARHWTRRTPWGTNRRLWCSWAVRARAAGGPSVYFGGDSGYASFFSEVGARLGPFDASLIPIGAYEPSWFMSAAHMNPEEAVRAYQDLGDGGVLIPTHWGTFRLTFEPPLEPPERARAAWRAAGLDPAYLRIPMHGETIVIER